MMFWKAPEYKIYEPQTFKETVTTITYTLQFKELTDEEYEALEYLIEEFGNVRFMEGNTGMNLSEMSDEILERFRAILRKARE